MKLSTISGAAALGALSLGLLLPLTHAFGAAGSWSGGAGNSYGGVSGSFNASAKNGPTSADASIGASGSVRFLSRTYEALSANASAWSKGSTGGANATVKLAGYTVWSKSGSYTLDWSASAARTFASGSTVVTVGPVPITLSGSVGGSLDGRLTLSVLPSKVGMTGSVEAGAVGNASAGLGIPGYNVSISATLELLRYGISPSLEVSYKSLKGRVEAFERAHTITLDLLLKAWPLKWTKNLATYSVGGWNRKLLSL